MILYVNLQKNILNIKNCYVFSQKDYKQEKGIQFIPMYLAPFL